MGGCFSNSNSNRSGLYAENASGCATNFDAKACLTHDESESKALRMKRCIDVGDIVVGKTGDLEVGDGVFLLWEDLHYKGTYTARGNQVFNSPRGIHMGQKTVARIAAGIITFTDGHRVEKYKIKYREGVRLLTHELCSGVLRTPDGRRFRLVGMAKERSDIVVAAKLVF